MEIAFIPRWFLNLLSIKYLIQKELNILLSNLLIVLIFLILQDKVIEILNIIPHFCLFDKISGIECPACGTTRAFCKITEGNYLSATRLNFSSIIAAFCILIQIPLRMISICNYNSIDKINSISKILEFGLIGFMVINWLCNLLFPKNMFH